MEAFTMNVLIGLLFLVDDASHAMFQSFDSFKSRTWPTNYLKLHPIGM